MKSLAWFGWIAMALVALASACTLVADVDYRAPPEQPPDTPEGLSDSSGGAAGSAG